MSTTHPSIVVADGQEVVDGHPMLGVDHILRHVKPLKEGYETLGTYLIQFITQN